VREREGGEREERERGTAARGNTAASKLQRRPRASQILVIKRVREGGGTMGQHGAIHWRGGEGRTSRSLRDENEISVTIARPAASVSDLNAAP